MTNRVIRWFRFASPQEFYPLAGRMLPWFAGLAAVQARIPERDGFADSRRYREALSKAVEAAQKESRAHPRPDRRQQLLIEFVAADRSACYAFYLPELAEGAEGLEIARRFDQNAVVFIERGKAPRLEFPEG